MINVLRTEHGKRLLSNNTTRLPNQEVGSSSHQGKLGNDHCCLQERGFDGWLYQRWEEKRKKEPKHANAGQQLRCLVSLFGSHTCDTCPGGILSYNSHLHDITGDCLSE